MLRREGSRQAQKRQKLIDAARLKRVAQKRRPPDYPHRWDDAYRLRVGDGGPNEWGLYLRRMARSRGISVAELARRSGVHRATIFGYIRDGGESATIASIRMIADALGDSVENAVLAAANVRPVARATDPESDPELDAILSAPVSNVMRMKMIRRLFDIREQEKQRHAEEIQRWINEAEAG
ncbi:MAG TPA: helix-turn-helix transcriptional regulator [Jiangellaceae bacterium]|nr:helix-turn-helix transcriptional regulator [Jiangellaceae bacterium]